MDENIYEKYIKAGKCASSARDYGIKLIKPGKNLLEISEQIEAKIRDQNCGIAFPVNISINEVAAHYSPRHDDNNCFKQGDVVKLDVGAHVNGYIADTAITIEIGTNKYKDMITASEKALQSAIENIKTGINLSTIGELIEKTITEYGYKPISNLTGHGLQQYELHSGLTVPNVGSMTSRQKPQEGDVVAIEPFATDGYGHVVSGKGSNIYRCEQTLKTKLLRDNRSKQYFEKFKNTFRTLPFAERWCQDLVPHSSMILKKLSYYGVLKHYPQLIEAKRGVVTQNEHTVIVHESECEVIT